ncbi:DNA-binding NarL/FixJ family response regulator [Cohnella thailandensis]|uniref:Response regulator transcription factor n=1 Tax=Cohnella thailandensis TaxID=557557 RepID=A0A841SQM1_9BACL|nr:response regulator transcription factor [Cohnella thailandensis]MBB6633492.1 response regulator transcription factor [Cohnella thailandensis]MBP1974509.1 DNA-binding NarL/FixJ family response regulator [Cohnella thailandensis]
MTIKILIADDNSFIREGMKIILTSYSDFEVVATVENGAEAVEYCLANEVDIALLDIRMPVMNGVEATRSIAERTKTKPFILTTFDDDEYVVEAIQAGARGYLLKNNEPDRIRDAIRSVFAEHRVLQDVVLDKLKTTLTQAPSAAETQPPASASPTANAEPACKIDRSLFTERELDVIALIAKGLSNKEIAKKLFISEGTVANHITSILNKTALEHRTQIAIYYLTGATKPAEE